METSISGWWFAPSGSTIEDIRLPNGDGRAVVDGETLGVTAEPVLCERGLHASERMIDALGYSQGSIVCRVVVSGAVVRGNDKLCGQNRKCEWRMDITNILHEFACRCAEKALRAANVTDERCWRAIGAKRAWLRGEITDSELAAARAAAWDASWAAASDAARAASWAASWAAARAAAWAAANKELEAMVVEAHEAAMAQELIREAN